MLYGALHGACVTRCWRGEQKNAAGTGVLILQNMSVETILNI